MRAEKQGLRRALKKVRADMPAEKVRSKSQAITDRLMADVDWTEIKNMHVYSAVSAWNEVRTEPIIEYARKQWPAIDITMPNISVSQALPKQQFDLIIVPCLGYDEDCYRLGLGGGFYDRFLAGQPKALKIGLAFGDGLVKRGLPREPHDIPLDEIITEEGIIIAHDS
jgi:5-formyltetrahydrofolate cyclo-ligase